MSNDIRVLSAGVHIPEAGAIGSGIYDGRRGILNYVFDPNSGTKLVTDERTFEWNGEARRGSRTVFVEDLSQYQWMTLNSQRGVAALSLGYGSSCKIEYDLDHVPTAGCYVALGIHGTRTFGASSVKRGIVGGGVVYFKAKPSEGVLPPLDKPDSGEMHTCGDYCFRAKSKFHYFRIGCAKFQAHKANNFTRESPWFEYDASLPFDGISATSPKFAGVHAN